MAGDDATVARQRLRASLALVAVTGIWGAAFPALKLAVACFGPGRTICWRFTLAALCLAPLAGAGLRAGAAARHGAALGAINLGVYGLMAFGIDRLPSARVAFLLSLSVVFVPVLEGLARRRWPRRRVLCAAALSLAGVATMTLGPADVPGAAELAVVGSAALTALGVLALAHLSARAAAPPAATSCYMMATTAAGAAPWALWSTAPAAIGPAVATAAVALVLSSVVATALAYGLQVRYAPTVEPSVAALIYALKPVVAALCAAAVSGEALGPHAVIGGAAIVVASVMPALGGRRLPPRAATAAAAGLPGLPPPVSRVGRGV